MSAINEIPTINRRPGKLGACLQFPLSRFVLALLAGLLAATASAQSLDFSPVRSISISENDVSDLEALGRDIGDARIVLLGEQTHGVGATFEAKARVIRYLHEQKGFDVLAFESGFAGLSLPDASAPSHAIRAGVLPVWSESEQVAPLLAYLDAQVAIDPMTIAGFDMFETGTYAEALAKDLGELSLVTEAARQAAGRISVALVAINTSGPRGLAEVDPVVLSADRDLVLAQISSLPAADQSVWRQRIISVSGFLSLMRGMLDGPTPALFNRRDAQMADNIRWLAEERYPGRKIIVWAASSHVIKDRSAIDASTDQTHEMVPAGSFVHAAMGDDAYVLAFTSGGGEVGSRNTGEVSDVGTPPAGSLEDMALASPGPYAFSPLVSDGRQRASWLLGYEPMTADWSRVVDGIFFIRRMTPTTYPK